MKQKTLLLTVLLGSATLLSAQEVKLNIPAGETAPAAASPAAAPAPANVTETQMLETFGWFVTMRIGIAELEFDDAQIQAFARGVALAAGGQPSPHDLPTVGPAMDEFITKRQEAALARERQRNLDEANAFFAAIKQSPGVVALPDGVCYEMLTEGTGPKVQATDTVKINYTGMLLDGQVFDSSDVHGEPLIIALNQSIPGWSSGVQQLSKGGKIKLYIPPHLAYGDEGAGAIPPGAALIFEIELLEINPVVAAVPAAAEAAK